MKFILKNDSVKEDIGIGYCPEQSSALTQRAK